MLRAVTVDGGGSGYSHGRALLTIFVFVKMDFGHPLQGGVDDNKNSFCLYRAFVCLCVGAAGACAHDFGVQKSPHVSPCFQGISLARNLHIQLRWLTTEPWESYASAFAALTLQAHVTVPRVYAGSCDRSQVLELAKKALRYPSQPSDAIFKCLLYNLEMGT